MRGTVGQKTSFLGLRRTVMGAEQGSQAAQQVLQVWGDE
jgi:hypothetical protein